jgi:hypothetical protein
MGRSSNPERVLNLAQLVCDPAKRDAIKREEATRDDPFGPWMHLQRTVTLGDLTTIVAMEALPGGCPWGEIERIADPPCVLIRGNRRQP